mmetsp:Transcript_11344/g.27531  ORF Transcript_11344/g.27531 Transcript_11344/m.27531 type:complete len:346 (-) Transcript_11344:2168-3205(-)
MLVLVLHLRVGELLLHRELCPSELRARLLTPAALLDRNLLLPLVLRLLLLHLFAELGGALEKEPEEELGLRAVRFLDRRVRLWDVDGVVVGPHPRRRVQVGQRLEGAVDLCDSLLVEIHPGGHLVGGQAHRFETPLKLGLLLLRVQALPSLHPRLGAALPRDSAAFHGELELVSLRDVVRQLRIQDQVLTLGAFLLGAELAPLSVLLQHVAQRGLGFVHLEAVHLLEDLGASLDVERRPRPPLNLGSLGVGEGGFAVVALRGRLLLLPPPQHRSEPVVIALELADGVLGLLRRPPQLLHLAVVLLAPLAILIPILLHPPLQRALRLFGLVNLFLEIAHAPQVPVA